MMDQRSVTRKSRSVHQRLPKDVVTKDNTGKPFKIVIGPEGGLDDVERTLFTQHDSIVISLGNHILPTETAALFVLGWLSAQFL